MENITDCEINFGQYVIIQRQNYNKLHLISEKCNSVFLGRDKVELIAIIGTCVGTSFKMIPKKGTNREFTLNVCSLEECVSSDVLLKDVASGIDNRNIFDDGSSQLLSSDSISELRDSGISPQQIIGQLIENSKTFCNKTEYSQVKYLKKKDKKYFEYITIHRPTLRMLAEILYNRDGPKNVGLRIDTLSQITTATNFQPDGTYILFENGYHGLVAATCLNSLSDGGQLILVTPGSQGQKQAILAMNFNELQLSRLLTVRASTLMHHLKKININTNKNDEKCTNNELLNISSSSIISCDKDLEGVDNCNQQNREFVKPSTKEDDDELDHDIRKRKYSNDSNSANFNQKKPRWAEEAEKATDILCSKKIDGLIIVCKEFPSNILNTFLSYLAPSRPFVVYSLYQEPLVQLYIDLKKRGDIIYLRITETWLRSYQVLPDRTHPAVNMSPTSGFLLSGLIVASETL